jgi:hypothetical protein
VRFAPGKPKLDRAGERARSEQKETNPKGLIACSLLFDIFVALIPKAEESIGENNSPC